MSATEMRLQVWCEEVEKLRKRDHTSSSDKQLTIAFSEENSESRDDIDEIKRISTMIAR